MAFGIWVFGQLADRIGRKPIFISFQIGAMIIVLDMIATVFLIPELKGKELG